MATRQELTWCRCRASGRVLALVAVLAMACAGSAHNAVADGVQPVARGADATIAPQAATAPSTQPTSTADDPAAEKIDFATQVQPILITHCYRCHGPDKRSGGLRLHSLADAKAGGDSGKPIVGGTLDSNELYQRVSSSERTYRMPKNSEPLAEQDVARIRHWVEQGSPWPAPRKGEAIRLWFFDRWLHELGRFEGSYAAEISYLKPFLFLFILSQVVILAVSRLKAAHQKNSSWALGRGRALCAFCGGIGRRELFMAWLLTFASVTVMIFWAHDRKLSREVAAIQRAKATDDNPWSKTIYGFPPVPIRPAHPKRLSGTYYRGNCERSPALFNNGNYLTAVFRVRLCNAKQEPLEVGDAMPTDGMFVRMELDRAPGTSDLLYGKEMMAAVRLSEYFRGAELDPARKKVIALDTLEDGHRWAANYPLIQPDTKAEIQPDAKTNLSGVIYIYAGIDHETMEPNSEPHYAIGYALVIEDGKLAPDCEIWMDSFGNSAFNPPELPGRLSYREWFDYRPIPVISGGNTKDPKLLGVEEYVRKGLIPPSALTDGQGGKKRGDENPPPVDQDEE